MNYDKKINRLIKYASYNFKKNKDYLNYEESKKFIKPFKIKTSKEYISWYMIYKPLPLYSASQLQINFKKDGFSWPNFLGVKKITNQQKKSLCLSYHDCSKFAKEVVKPWSDKRNITDCMKRWKEYKTNNELPDNIPKDPRDKYSKDKNEWGGWNGFFGIDKIYNNKKYRAEKKDKLKTYQCELKNDIDINITSLNVPGIYLYEFPDNKKYVGQTITTISNRTYSHINDALKNNRCILLERKIRKLNPQSKNNNELEDIFYKNVEITILHEGYEDLDKLEIKYIDEYKTYRSSTKYNGENGLNMNPGNNSDDCRKKIEMFDHNNEPLRSGISYKKDKGYISTIYFNSKRVSKEFKSLKLSMDEKLERAINFKKLQKEIISILDMDNKILNFEKQIGIYLKERKIGHKKNILPHCVFYDKDKGYNIAMIINDKDKRTLTFYEIECHDKQLDLVNKFIDKNTEEYKLFIKTNDELKGYIKKNKIPIKIGKTSSKLNIIQNIINYKDPIKRKKMNDEYKLLLEWHSFNSDIFPNEWKRRITKYKYYEYKHPNGIICKYEKVAINYTKKDLPNLDNIILNNSFHKNLSWNEFRSDINKYIPKNTFGWKPMISKAYKNYKQIYQKDNWAIK